MRLNQSGHRRPEKRHLPSYLKGKWKWREQKIDERVYQAGVAFTKALWYEGA